MLAECGSICGSRKITRVDENVEQSQRQMPGVGLCADCIHMQLIKSDKGSVFYFCKLSLTDPGFPKYPRLPVVICDGFEPKSGH